MGTIHIVMGGQFGSEGKGAFIHWYCRKYRPAAVVRTGGPNAGHSMIVNGNVHKMQGIPCAWDVPESLLVIAPGSVIDSQVIVREMAEARSCGYNPMLCVDNRATLLTRTHSAEEAESGLVGRLGSTAHGIGAARADRIWRTADLARCSDELAPWLGDAAPVLLDLLEDGEEILVETPQGWGLSLHGPYYPFCTSHDLTPAQALADCGLPIGGHEIVVTMVLRTMPIRVAGNSGPLAHETSWETLAKTSGGYITAEKTTVTKKTRRIGYWDDDLAMGAVEACRPDQLVITFLDYVDPEARALDVGEDGKATLPTISSQFCDDVTDLTGVPVRWASVGFEKVVQL
jgi:adenylosuccinate synthase